MDLMILININLLIAGDFNSSLSPDRSSEQQQQQKIEKYHNYLICRNWTQQIFKNIPPKPSPKVDQTPNIKQYTFCSVAHRSFSELDHILGHKTILYKLKKSKVPLFFSFCFLRLDFFVQKFLGHTGTNSVDQTGRSISLPLPPKCWD